MPPENTAPQFGQPSLPPLPPQAAAVGVPTPSAGVQEATPQSVPANLAPVAATSTSQTANVVAEAKRIMEQYAGSPYQQSMALQQLKTSYISQQFHIEPKRTQN